MTSFGWNKKIGGKVLKRAAETFAENTKPECQDDEVDWISLLPKRANIASLEDVATKSQRLKLEGEKLAESERYDFFLYVKPFMTWDVDFRVNI